MDGRGVLMQLAIPVPQVQFSGGRSCTRLLTGIAIDLAKATRQALEGGSVDHLIDQIDRAEPWPPLASGVVVSAEVLAHIADTRRASVPHRSREEDT